MQEVNEVVFSMKGDKSLGPDDVPPAFFQKKLDAISHDVLNADLSFLNGGHLLREMNETYITIIPNTSRPESVAEFRTISLCNTSYKIISKCLVRRLKTIMKEITGDFQNAFIPGRLLSDNCHMAHGMMNSMKRMKKEKRMAAVLKVDLNKAYERISWDFLEKTPSNNAIPEGLGSLDTAMCLKGFLLYFSQWRSVSQDYS